MENIIFCGGCGTFISAVEVSAGKASRINNIYYCQKCSTGTQQTQARPVPASLAARPQTGKTVVAPPRQPAPTVWQAPAQPQPRPAAPAAKPSTPVQAQRPAASRPVAQPARPARPAPLPQPRKIAPVQSQPKTSRLSPAQMDAGEEGFEELDASAPHRFGKPKTSKGGIKKIYLIAGAAAVVIIIAMLVIINISNAAKQKAEEEHLQTLRKAFKFIEDAESDYPDEPQKIIDEIKKQADKLKGTEYEKKVAEKQENAKALIEVLNKINELEKPVDTAEDVDKRVKDISALRSNPAVTANKTIDSKLRELLTLFTKQKKKFAEEEKKAREAQEAADKKAYEDFKAKIEALRGKKEWKEMLRECDILLGRPNGLQYQEDADKIKEEAKAALEEQQEKARKRKDWQILNDDITKWDRSGNSKSEIYVDDDKIFLKNSGLSSNRGAVTSIANNNDGDGWKDFTMTLEFKVVSGSFEMFLRGGYQAYNITGLGTINLFSGIPIPFPRKFKEEWQKYTIELKGNKLTISGTGLPEPKTSDVQEGTGGIGINVKGGDNIIVKELKVKVIE